MTILFEKINTTLNWVHEWGEFDQHPMKRLFLTRIGTIACLFLETAAAAYAMAKTGVVLFREIKRLATSGLSRIFPKSSALQAEVEVDNFCKKECIAFGQRIAGLISTLFVGIFSPEINFRNHKKLHLAIDNLSEKKERELKLKLETELKDAQIKRDRLLRFTQQQAERDKKQLEEEREQRIDARLAELLCT